MSKDTKFESPLMRIAEVEQYIGLRRNTIYIAMEEERFPRPIKLTNRAVAWLKAEIDQWLEERIAMRGEALRKRA